MGGKEFFFVLIVCIFFMIRAACNKKNTSGFVNRIVHFRPLSFYVKKQTFKQVLGTLLTIWVGVNLQSIAHALSKIFNCAHRAGS